MKHVVILSMGVLLAAYTPEVHAQAFLKGLADKAKAKVEKKVENAADNAVDKVLNMNLSKNKKQAATGLKAPSSTGNSGDGVVTTRGTYAPGEDPYIIFVDELAAPDVPTSLSGIFDEVELQEAKEVKFPSFADAVKAFPSFPTAEQVVNQDTIPIKAMRAFKKGCEYLIETTAESVTKIQLKAKAKVSGKNSAASSSPLTQMNGDAMQILKLMQKHGIDPEKTSEKDMQAFVLKMISTGELKMPTGGGVIDADYSDEQESAIDKVSAKVDALEGKVNEFVAEHGLTISMPGHDRELRELYAKLQATWKGSSEYKQVYDIEKDIDKRSLDYFEHHPDYRKGTDIPYPAFWVEGRKKENEIIRKVNIACAGMWLQSFSKVQEAAKPLCQEVADVDAELEVTFSDKEDLIYATLKHRILVAFQSLTIYYPVIVGNTYGLPLVETVGEDDKLYQAM